MLKGVLHICNFYNCYCEKGCSVIKYKKLSQIGGSAIKTIILVRHGQSTTNLNGVFTGQLDAPLTELGLEQAHRMAAYLDSYTIDHIYASSLTRAVETAQAIALRQNCPLETADAFREINAGFWQGLTFDEIARRYPKTYGTWKTDIGAAEPDGGESCRLLYERVIGAFRVLAEDSENRTICIVAHAIPIRMIESYITANTVAVAKDIPWVPNASVTVYQFDGSYHAIVRGYSDFLLDLQTNLPKSI